MRPILDGELIIFRERREMKVIVCGGFYELIVEYAQQRCLSHEFVDLYQLLPLRSN